MSVTSIKILVFCAVYALQIIIVFGYIHDGDIRTRKEFLLWMIPFSWVGYLIYRVFVFFINGIAKLK